MANPHAQAAANRFFVNSEWKDLWKEMVYLYTYEKKEGKQTYHPQGNVDVYHSKDGRYRMDLTFSCCKIYYQLSEDVYGSWDPVECGSFQ